MGYISRRRDGTPHFATMTSLALSARSQRGYRFESEVHAAKDELEFLRQEANRKIGSSTNERLRQGALYGVPDEQLEGVLRGENPKTTNVVKCLVSCASSLWVPGLLFLFIVWCGTMMGLTPVGAESHYDLLMDDVVQELSSDIVGKIRRKCGANKAIPYDDLVVEKKFSGQGMVLHTIAKTVPNRPGCRTMPELSPTIAAILSYSRRIALRFLQTFAYALRNIMRSAGESPETLAEDIGLSIDKIYEMYVSCLT